MASKPNNYYIASTLLRRGWTEELMAQLLEPPARIRVAGKPRRAWKKEDVDRAEKTELFKTTAKPPEPGVQLSDRQAFDAGKRLLLEAGEALVSEDDPVSRLARAYHRAICEGLPTSNRARELRGGHASSYIQAFLTLPGNKTTEEILTDLRHFTYTATWLGRHPDSGNISAIRERYAIVLTALAKKMLALFSVAQPEADSAALLDMEDFPYGELLSHPLSYIYSVFYVPRAIRGSLNLLIALNPKDEYPEARAMKRHFILHLGGTNTGKTYAGFQRLMEAETGVYLAPLRLLALEAQETLLDAHVKCSLTTGEEEDCKPGDTHVAATTEKLDLNRHFDVAVIDECQMIADSERGFAWTRAILGARIPEIHLCAAPEAKPILLSLIRACGDDYEIVYHKRKTPLVCMEHQVDYDSLRPGDALITFSKVGVLSIAEDLRRRGKEPAIIYGALPYSTRRKQMEGFLAGDMEYVVSTDAIGMGLNLPIRRIIFMDTKKFDGHERRSLKPEEIQQIAGRAGRYGMYDKGYVGAMENLSEIRVGLESVVPPIQKAVVGFSDLTLSVDFDLLEVLTEWNRMPTVEPYVKLDVSRYIYIISAVREAGFQLSKEEELRCANIPFDETEPELYRLFLRFLRIWQEGEPFEQPTLPEKKSGAAHTLPELELYCRKLDLYFSFAKAFALEVDREALYDEREAVADAINQILLHNLRNNIRFCASCGTALPLHIEGRYCTRCYNRRMGGSYRGRRKK